jgi:hypothetical protein
MRRRLEEKALPENKSVDSAVEVDDFDFAKAPCFRAVDTSSSAYSHLQ